MSKFESNWVGVAGWYELHDSFTSALNLAQFYQDSQKLWNNGNKVILCLLWIKLWVYRDFYNAFAVSKMFLTWSRFAIKENYAMRAIQWSDFMDQIMGQ